MKKIKDFTLEEIKKLVNELLNSMTEKEWKKFFDDNKEYFEKNNIKNK